MRRKETEPYRKNVLAMRNDIDPLLLKLLICPLTKGPLRYDADAQELVSTEAHIAFPIRDGVPILLLDEARAL